MKQVLGAVVVAVLCGTVLADNSKAEETSGSGIKTSGRIVGGSAANIASYPFVLAFNFKDQTVCTATVISNTRALTAAHCIVTNGIKDPSQIKLLGGSSLKSGSYSFGVRSFGVHVAYNPATNANDIAFVEPSVSFDKVKGIVAAGRAVVEPPIGSNCFTLGWGWTDPVKRTLSDKLLLASYTIVSEASCTSIPGYTKTGTTLCGMPVAGKGTTCNGDSGGPLVCIVDGKGLLHGIVSAGNSACNGASVFAKLTAPSIANFVSEILAG